jgi:hypothetical protein
MIYIGLRSVAVPVGLARVLPGGEAAVVTETTSTVSGSSVPSVTKLARSSGEQQTRSRRLTAQLLI